ncbi:MAG: hypothetical protein OSJ69_08755 [Acetatifactor sp.]|nr:hypothetical protein [Acetatifactor sp.]
MKKKVLAILLSAAMAFSLSACGDSGNEPSSDASTPTSEAQDEPSSQPEQSTEPDTPSAPAETTVIRYGMHWLPDIDPNNTDAVTGEYTMDEARRQASLAGLQAIKDTYNVEFEFLQFPNDVQEDLMTSVLAGDPICDLAVLWNGVEPTILAQNVVQDLTPYMDLFEGEGGWVLGDPLFGGNYLMSHELAMTDFPLVVNLTMLEKVDALKDESGRTIYPMDLFKEGNWTWSAFEDYLSKVQAYYANVEAPDGATFDYVKAYETDHRYAALAAMYANGGGIVKDGEVAADSEESIEAVQFIDKLMKAELLVDCGVYDDGFTPRWTDGGRDIGLGATVFTDCPSWWIGGAASSCAERGESIGIIPWPRPDDVAQDSEDYQQNASVGNSTVVLKGVPEDRARLAIQSFMLYWETYYKTLGNVESASEYRSANAASILSKDYGVDVYNETYGDSLIECYNYILGNLGLNYAGKMGLWDRNWEYIVGKSLYGMDGMSSYDVAIKANLTDLTNPMNTIAEALKSNEVHDNRGPAITKEDVVLEAGTDPAGVDWTQYFSAEDSVDGTIAVTADNITVSEELDLATPGEYGDAVVVKVADTSGNESEGKIKVTVYNPSNTTAPTVEVKAELPTVALNTETSGINWADYLESAKDADGIDVKDKVTADLSELDTTTPGSYNVVLTVTDYAGNTSEVTVEVTVE